MYSGAVVACRRILALRCKSLSVTCHSGKRLHAHFPSTYHRLSVPVLLRLDKLASTYRRVCEHADAEAHS